jgi:NADPH-dependent glutamate synthase beta subunit-like oxidoreductase/Pyruvate/2-oxoacid:ferredoxin oxidoreductase delta subunit
MAASKDEMNRKLTFRLYQDGDHKWRSQGENIFLEDTSHKCPTYVHRTPPCQGSCPSGEDIRGWLDIVRGIEKPPEGVSMQEYAFQRSTDANPFPSMMGRVCPAPCEQGCNRNAVEEFVGINAVEQYIGDTAKNEAFRFANPPSVGSKKVAIVGGGPAGLAAAYQLRRRGIASTIFDEHEELGGMFRYGIPGYRTPREFLDHEISRIIEMGDIETRMKTRIGCDVSIDQIEADYDAVLWAIGCQSGRALPLENSDAPNCISGVAFLEAFNKGALKVTADRVICIGGGDTSIDVVSVARRLGKIDSLPRKQLTEYVVGGFTAHDSAFAAAREGAKVTLTSLFEKSQMTASEHEVEDALKEGVTIIDGVMPIEIIIDDTGRATALKLAKCTLEDGNPAPVEGSEFTIECDLIVSAIGQGGDLSGIEELGNDHGLMDADKFYAHANREGHFVAGDIIRPHLLTTAIGHASVAADSIEKYLEGGELTKRPKVDVHHFDLLSKLRETDLSPSEYDHQGNWGTIDADYAVHNYEDRSAQEIISSDRLYLGHFNYEERNLRVSHGPDSRQVLGHFEERSTCLNEEQAIKEAGRCMSCGMCFECDNCVIYCPQDAVYRVKKDEKTMGRYVATDYDKCIGCHICADVCPTGYIDMALGDH